MSDGAQLIRERARDLPDGPGCYLYKDRSDTILYVGKAKSLRKRVGSYARADRLLDRKTHDLVARVAGVETVVTATESEAFMLEQTLIRRHRPPFNVRLRDDKSYPYIAVTVGDRYPRVLFTRERHRRGVRYFGPYSSAYKVRATLDVLSRVFPYRPCEGPQPGRRSGIPCLDYHIGRCGAPCVGYISEAGYREIIDGVIEFLSGRTRGIERRLEAEMSLAAQDQRFEDAARARNRLTAIRSLAERQLTDNPGTSDLDVVGIARSGGLACVQLFPVRGGKLGDRFSFIVENAEGASEQEILEAFASQRYGPSDDVPGAAVPPLVLVGDSVEEPLELQRLLADRRGAAIEVRIPQRGEKRRLLELAETNARHALEGERLRGERTRERQAGALEELREALNLETLPERIECFDISNLGEESTMASMVVFEGGVSVRSHYRIFGIERDGGPNDFASMGEAVRRRFARLVAARAGQVGDEPADVSFSSTPDLVVIDGGKGQLGAALIELRAFDLPRVACVGLAKRIEEVFLPGEAAPVVLPDDSPALLLLRAIRDEAHRFALSHHRKRRGRSTTASVVDQIPGVGPARKRALLQHFRTPQAILSASPTEMEAVPGLPPKTARAIWDYLHKTGEGPGGATVVHGSVRSG